MNDAEKEDINDFFRSEIFDAAYEQTLWLSINSSFMVSNDSYALNQKKGQLNLLNKLLNLSTLDEDMM